MGESSLEEAFAPFVGDTLLGHATVDGEHVSAWCQRCKDIRNLVEVAVGEFARAAVRDLGNATQGRRSREMEDVRRRIAALGGKQ